MTPTDPTTLTAAASDTKADTSDSRGRLVLRRFRRRRHAVLGLLLVVLFFVFAYIGPAVYKWNYTQLDFESFLERPSADHWFGTTQNGFDVLALTMRGMQKSL